MAEFDEKEMYLYLDFEGRLNSNLFKRYDKVPLKITNFGSQPIVYIGDDIYLGTYDDCVGTNVFFEEVDELDSTDEIFIKETPIKLKYFVKEDKEVKLKSMKLIRKKDPKPTYPDVHVTDDRATLMEKLKNGTLCITSYENSAGLPTVTVKTEGVDKSVELGNQVEKPLTDSYQTEQELISESVKKLVNEPMEVLINESVKELVNRSAKELANESVSEFVNEPMETNEMVLSNMVQNNLNLTNEAEKVDTVKEHEWLVPVKTVKEFEFEVKNKKLKRAALQPPKGNCEGNRKDFEKVKHSYMRSLENKSFPMQGNDETLEGWVNVQQSIKDEIIQPDKLPEAFTEEDKNQLISLRNFENVSPPLQLILLLEHLKFEEQIMENMTLEELNEKDKHGRSPKQRHKLLKMFAKDLIATIIQHLKKTAILKL